MTSTGKHRSGSARPRSRALGVRCRRPKRVIAALLTRALLGFHAISVPQAHAVEPGAPAEPLAQEESISVRQQRAKVDAWRALAEAGNAQAQFALGVIHERAEGVERNFVAAADWYRQAAAQGLPEASYNLGNLYLEGRGVAQSASEAVALFRVAAAQGLLPAQFNLAYAYDTGTGTARNRPLAAAWYARAAVGGSEDARQRLYELREDGVRPAALPAVTEAGNDRTPAGAGAGERQRRDPMASAKPASPPSPPADPGAAGADDPTGSLTAPLTEPDSPGVTAAVGGRPTLSGDWYLQLGAFRSPARTVRAWHELTGAHEAELGSLSPVSQPVDLGSGKGTFLRLLAGPLVDRADAAGVCDRIASGGGVCLLKRITDVASLRPL